ncbi:MAG: hypothetical protein ACT4PG_11275 [Panacagrimonas sp.]
MRLSPLPRLATRVRILAGTALLLIGAQAAQAAVDPALINEVLDLDQQVHTLERANHGESSFTIFISSRAQDLRLRKVRVRIDDQTAVEYEYALPEWEAIAAGGAHPVWSGALSEGEHRLQLELFARTVDAGPNDARAVQRLDQRIHVQRGMLLEFELTQQRFGKTALSQHEWSDSAVRGAEGLAHPWLRAGAFWLDADRPLDAARLLKRELGRNSGATWSQDAAGLLSLSLQRLSGQNLRPDPAHAGLQRLNSTVQSAASGDAQAVLSLAEMGQTKAVTESDWILRDAANLALGYHHLHRHQGPAALEALARVRTTGPHGNQALLAFGWAFLQPEPAAGVVTQISAPPLRQSLQQPAFVIAAQAPASGAEASRKQALESALIAWTELVGLHPLDEAAQEGALALAWALDQLRTGRQAHTYYQRAATQLESARSLLDQAMAQVREGHTADAIAKGQRDASTGWHLWLSDLPYADNTAYLKYLLADPVFVASVRDYQLARGLRDEVEHCAQRAQALASAHVLLPNLNSALHTARAREHNARQQMDARALALLQAQKQRTERYLVEARFALARHFDYALEPEIEIKRKAAAGAPS